MIAKQTHPEFLHCICYHDLWLFISKLTPDVMCSSLPFMEETLLPERRFLFGGRATHWRKASNIRGGWIQDGILYTNTHSLWQSWKHVRPISREVDGVVPPSEPVPHLATNPPLLLRRPVETSLPAPSCQAADLLLGLMVGERGRSSSHHAPHWPSPCSLPTLRSAVGAKRGFSASCLCTDQQALHTGSQQRYPCPPTAVLPANPPALLWLPAAARAANSPLRSMVAGRECSLHRTPVQQPWGEDQWGEIMVSWEGRGREGTASPPLPAPSSLKFWIRGWKHVLVNGREIPNFIPITPTIPLLSKKCFPFYCRQCYFSVIPTSRNSLQVKNPEGLQKSPVPEEEHNSH